jgi:trehalose 6-phosphate synthase/phosphatase
MTRPTDLARAVAALRSAPALLVLLDYDGTLVPFADLPHLAAPDPALLRLVTRLAERPRTAVHIVSGRARDALEQWLGALPVSLHAEHGFWSRSPAGTWEGAPLPDLSWMERARAVLETFRAKTPGSLIEQKTVAIAWHYRMADPRLGARRANDLRLRLADTFPDGAVAILAGDKVVELRPRGVHKGRVVEQVTRDVAPGTALLAMGDDRTDEDMFAALPPGGTAVHVGHASSRAPLRVQDWQGARAILEQLVGDAGSRGGPV